MRLDLFLKKTRIIKRRTVAKKLIEEGLVKVNGRLSKPSKTIHPEMIIEIDTKKYRVKKIPKREIRKNEGEKYYKVIDDRNNTG